ncbi:unnamed protein product [Penicillium salamii]|uniref:DUF7730 domain-containing protein n=1 Tax=Penicillium salamii TaxID=1612424 RepID=A0A9W4IEW0_9EURO|nr:unnamed protein product [Penicillium salamii]CAG8102560.1 unnamed protein product [Penicillium salamii]CAG8103874.1 unnamed protein product [Penicillium salamii]CAG8118701.1 unnamed protein product [Penicillium salamii]CAG8290341.1 unnamed protein product [Penicillium salamii]
MRGEEGREREREREERWGDIEAGRSLYLPRTVDFRPHPTPYKVLGHFPPKQTIVMAPNILSKMFKCKKEKPPGNPPKEWSPNAIGISDSTCEINGDIFNPWKFPVPPPQYHIGKIGARRHSPQNQSDFFRLPNEIRRMIYLELMGDRRVHIRHVWSEPSSFVPKPKRRGPRWDWWHCVCGKSNRFPEDLNFDSCGDWRDEAAETKELKIKGVEWLRSCQIGYEEALQVLYGTNVFAMKKALNNPFLISRKISPRCTTQMTSMDISLPVSFPCPQSTENDYMTTYCALFDLLRDAFRGVHFLRVELDMPPFDQFVEFFNEERMNAILEPMDQLSKSRSWTKLQLCVPCDWYTHFEKSKEMMAWQAEWQLTETEWSQQLLAVCIGMT